MLDAALTDLLQPWRLVTLLLSLAVSVLVLATSSRVEAQADALVVLATTLETPVLEPLAAAFTDEPELLETTVAGLPTTVARPGGGREAPTLVVVNGAAEEGRTHPVLQRLASGLARAGYVVLVPELPGLARGELTEDTVQATIDVARAGGDRVGFVGVSVGTSLALVAAADEALAGRVSVITGTAPYADLSNLVRLATTGYYRDGDLLLPHETDPFLAVAVARSIASALPAGPQRDALLALDDDTADPLAPLRTLDPETLAPDVRSIVELLVNEDPRRFDELYAAAPAELRGIVERLSPLTAAAEIEAKVELASAPQDEYVPLAEPQAFVHAAPDARLTITRTLEHAIPDPSAGSFRELVELNGWVVRSLQAAASE